MRTIITGGTGLIGSALAADLAASGEEVILLSRDPSRTRSLPSGVRAERWDGHSAAGWGALADGARAIVNLAGESIAGGRWTAARKQRILESRVNAGRAVVEAVQAAATKPQVVVQASAVGFYGPRGTERVTESSDPGSDFMSLVCQQWEQSTATLDTLGVRRTVIRTGIVLSRKGGALPKLLLPFRFFAGGPLGNGRQGFPWIHIADQVAAMRFLIENPAARGPFNLSAPSPLPNREFSQALGRAMGRPSVMPAPAFMLRLALGEMATVLLDGQLAVPDRLLAESYRFRFVDAETALRDLLS